MKLKDDQLIEERELSLSFPSIGQHFISTVDHKPHN